MAGLHILCVAVSFMGIIWIVIQNVFSQSYANGSFSLWVGRIRDFTYVVISLASLDLVVCGIIFKLFLGASANSRVVIDPKTGLIYYISDAIPIGGRIPSGEVNSEDEDNEVETIRIPTFARETFTELGFDGSIISQLITIP